MSAPLPQEILPHGPGMQLLDGGGELVDGWLRYHVTISSRLSVLEDGAWAPPELGLEMMAQACGMLTARDESSLSSGPRMGVVGAVRGYSYEPTAFQLGDEFEVRVRAEMVEDALVVCEGALHRKGSETPLQQARITLILSDVEAR